MLARMTYHIEQQSSFAFHCPDYMDRSVKKPIEIEHRWADKYEWHDGELASPAELQEHRSGGLVLLPLGFKKA